MRFLENSRGHPDFFHLALPTRARSRTSPPNLSNRMPSIAIPSGNPAPSAGNTGPPQIRGAMKIATSSMHPASNHAPAKRPPHSKSTVVTPSSLARSRSKASGAPHGTTRVRCAAASVKSGAAIGNVSGRPLMTILKGVSRPSRYDASRRSSRGRSRLTVSPPVTIASQPARNLWTSPLAASPVNHIPSPSGRVRRASRVIADFHSTQGRPQLWTM